MFLFFLSLVLSPRLVSLLLSLFISFSSLFLPLALLSLSFCFFFSSLTLPCQRMRPRAGRTLFCCTCRRTWVGARSLYTAALYLISSRPFHSERRRERGREGGVPGGLTEAGPKRGGKGAERERNRRKVRRPTCIYRNLQSGWERWRRSFTNWPGLSVPKWSLHVFSHSVCKEHKQRGATDKATSRHARKVVLLCFFVFFFPSVSLKGYRVISYFFRLHFSAGVGTLSPGAEWCHSLIGLSSFPELCYELILTHTHSLHACHRPTVQIHTCERLAFVTSAWCIHYIHAKRSETSESSFFRIALL